MGSDQFNLLTDELENFKEITRLLKPSPGEIPRLDGIDIDGVSMPLYGAIGGDHIIYVDFKRRYDLDGRIADALAARRAEISKELAKNRRRAGILLADVAGHRVTDALVAAMLHQAFLLGSYYELEMYGHITTRLFEHIQTRFYESTNIKKLVAMIYGEITDEGRFRYVSAGHTPPLVFSREYGRLMPLGADRTVSHALLGMFPATAEARTGDLPGSTDKKLSVNEIELLGEGDILLLATDGFTEHSDGRFVSEALEPCLNRVKERGAADICGSLREAVLEFGAPQDDITFVVIKKI
jgi:serine phosphatase RsbU (regulator of sigma subunit)